MTSAAVARLGHLAGGELEQIQFLLGHVSVQTTERYLGCKQKLRNAVNDGIDLAEEAKNRPRDCRRNALKYLIILCLVDRRCRQAMHFSRPEQARLWA